MSVTRETSVKDDFEIFIKIEDVQRILNIGRNKAYKLVKTDGFPKIQFGNTIRIPKSKFEQYIKANYNHKINI